MLTATTIGQLNKALENSFAAIKRDMQDIKLSLNAQAEQNAQIRKELDDTKISSVSGDKLNVLKIKIGEMSEELNKVSDMEKQIKTFDAAGSKKSVLKEIDTLNAKLIALNMKLDDTSKHAVTETQLKTLVAQLNGELNKLSQEVRAIEFKDDLVERKELNHYADKIAKRFDATQEHINDVRKTLKSYVDKDEMKRLLDEVNTGLDSIKRDVVTVNKNAAAFVKGTEVQSVLKNINNEFDKVAHEIAALKNQNKQSITLTQVKGLIEDISNEFEDVRKELSSVAKMNKGDDLRKSIEELRASSANIQRDVKRVEAKSVSKEQFTDELKKLDKELATQKVSATYGASVVMKDSAKVVKTKSTKSYLLGKFMIFISFVFLIVSIISYYIGEQTPMDNFAIAAVLAFLIGMLFKIYNTLKAR